MLPPPRRIEADAPFDSSHVKFGFVDDALSDILLFSHVKNPISRESSRDRIFIWKNSNIYGIINTNNYQIFVSHINNVGSEQNIILHSINFRVVQIYTAYE